MNTDVMMQVTHSLDEYLKQNYSASIENISSEIYTRQDYIEKILSTHDKKYQIIDGTISFKELGIGLCAVCGGFQDFDTIAVTLPDRLLANKTLDSRLIEGIYGHKLCYSKLNMFFRIQDIITLPKPVTCIDCNYFHEEEIAEDEMLEKCYKLKTEESGIHGIIAKNPICNFFDSSYNFKTELNPKEQQQWVDIRQLTAQKTNHGYNKLLEILLKTKLITDNK